MIRFENGVVGQGGIINDLWVTGSIHYISSDELTNGFFILDNLQIECDHFLVEALSD